MPVAKKCLIVDDEVNITFLTEKYPQLERYETLTCSNGHDALNIIKQNHEEIELVLLDLKLPDGYEILVEIKSNYPKFKVVLFSPEIFVEDIQIKSPLYTDEKFTHFYREKLKRRR